MYTQHALSRVLLFVQCLCTFELQFVCCISQSHVFSTVSQHVYVCFEPIRVPQIFAVDDSRETKRVATYSVNLTQSDKLAHPTRDPDSFMGFRVDGSISKTRLLCAVLGRRGQVLRGEERKERCEGDARNLRTRGGRGLAWGTCAQRGRHLARRDGDWLVAWNVDFVTAASSLDGERQWLNLLCNNSFEYE